MSRRAVSPAGGLSARDRAVVELVGKFRQLTSGHIRDCLFADLASTTPLDRTLGRLVDRGYLARLERLIGGSRSGSGQFVYQLGRQGWKLLGRGGVYWTAQAVNLHTLKIADCYVALKQAENENLTLIQFQPEPDCHLDVDDVRLTPDAYVEIGYRADQTKQAMWLEVDRSTEHLGKLEAKCHRYQRALRLWKGDFFPSVWFVVLDRQRKSKVDAMVQSQEVPALFDVRVIEELGVDGTVTAGG